MAAGDFVVRRNNANTDEIPDAGSTLDLLWDTSVDSEGSGITYSSGTFTLGETGRFLVAPSDQWGTTNTTNNERTNVRMSLILAGSRLNEGSSSGYVRRGGGSQEYINSGICYVNVSTTTGNGDELIVRHERVDNSTAGTVNRIADRSGVSIIKLDDDWNFAHYRSSAAYTPSSTDNTRNQADIGTTVEQDGSVFSRSSNQVTITTSNPVVVMYTHYNDQSDVHSGRTEMQGSIDFDGVELVRGVNQTYGPRATDNADYGIMSAAAVIYPDGTGQTLELNLISREDADEDWFTELQLIELPSGAETATVERSTHAGDVNEAGVNFAWETAVNVDTDAFTHSAGNANIDVDNADDYLALANSGNFTDAGMTGGGSRHVPAQGFRVNTTDQEIAGASSYNRQSGTADHAHMFCAGLLTDLSANDSVYLRHDRLGTASGVMVGAGGMSLIRLSSLFSTAGTTVTPAAITTSVSAPQASPVGEAAVSPAVVASTFALPAATPQGEALVAPAVITSATIMPAASATGEGAASPAAISAPTTLPGASVSGAGQVSPGSISTDVQVGSAVVTIGKTVTPANVETTVAVPTVTVVGEGLVTPSVFSATATLPAATPEGQAAVTPGVLAADTTIPQANTAAGSTVTPASLSLSVALPQAATVIGSGTVVTPAVISVDFAIGQATPSAPGSASPAAATTTVTLLQATPEGQGLVTPAMITLDVTAPQATPTVSETVTTGVLEATVSLPAASVAAASTVNPDAVAVVTAVPVSTPAGQGAASPDTVAIVVAIPQATGVAVGLVGLYTEGELIVTSSAAGGLNVGTSQGTLAVSEQSGNLDSGKQE